jgi:CHASE2 domain-containing sensor protein
MDTLSSDRFTRWINKIKTTPVLITTAIIILTLLVHQLGLTWWLSLKALDFFIGIKPDEPIDSRIVLVGIAEADIARFQNYPFTESQWASVLKRIEAGKPAVIGFDIFRDYPFPKGDNSLNEVFADNANIYGIAKLAAADPSGVPGPQVLAKRGAVTDVTYFPDRDGITRRAYLWAYPNKYPTVPNLGLQLALHYLEARGIKPSADREGNLRLKGVSIAKMTPDFGDYRDSPSERGGYPILLNWRKPLDRFPVFTVSSVLAPSFDASIFKGKIVLVGVGDTISVQDFLYAPDNKDIWGIQYLANITSSILSAVLDGRPLMKSWNNWQESLWIAFWPVVYSLIFWRLSARRSRALPLKSAGVLLGILALVWGFAYLAFLNGYWIPVALLSLSLPLLFTVNWIGLYIDRERRERERLKEETERARDFILKNEVFEFSSPVIRRFLRESYDSVTQFNLIQVQLMRDLTGLQNIFEGYLSSGTIDIVEARRYCQEITLKLHDQERHFDSLLFRLSFLPGGEILLPQNFCLLFDGLPDLTKSFIIFIVEIYQNNFSELGYLDNVIHYRVDPVNIALFPVSPAHYVQIITIFIDNALVALSYKRFDTDERPRVQLNVVTGTAAATISVRDNGSGLPAGIESARLFDKFTSRWPEPNERLGNELYRCDTLVRGYGGTLSLQDNDGYTEVSASIPLD